MFLNRIKGRNPNLIKAAVQLHRDRLLPPNTWVIDLDAIAHNADVLSAAASKFGLQTYIMTKQYARNPVVSRVAIKRGLHKTVAVDIQGAKMMWRYDIPVGHIGHLNQIPDVDIPLAVSKDPEVITCFSIQKAKAISDEATKQGKKQDLLLRVISSDDLFFEGQEGGIPESELEDVVKAIQAMPNVQLVGVTSFPCIRYNPTSDIHVEPSPNFKTIVRAAGKMRELGCDIKQINAPGNTSSETFPILKENGATHVEPGHGLLGTSPNHAFKDSLPEIPTYVYLTEVSHHVNGRAYTFGGGYWSDIYDPNYVSRALVGRDPEKIFDNELKSIRLEQIIDYHIPLTNGERCQVGDTAVFGFRTQMQMTRSQIAAVSGISKAQPKLEALFDHAGTMIDLNQNPVPMANALDIIADIESRY